MRIKKGVSTLGLKPEIVCIFPVVDTIFRGVTDGYIGAILTCGTDGKHTAKYSEHYKGYATDWRIRHLSNLTINGKKPKELIRLIVYELKSALTDDYNVILHKTHIHISYRPTR